MGWSAASITDVRLNEVAAPSRPHCSPPLVMRAHSGTTPYRKPFSRR